MQAGRGWIGWKAETHGPSRVPGGERVHGVMVGLGPSGPLPLLVRGKLVIGGSTMYPSLLTV